MRLGSCKRCLGGRGGSFRKSWLCLRYAWSRFPAHSGDVGRVGDSNGLRMFVLRVMFLRVYFLMLLEILRSFESFAANL